MELRFLAFLILFALAIFFAFALGVAAAAPAPKAVAGSCGPSFSEIYDFKVGDVFQGEQTSMSGGGLSVTKSHFKEKYAIVSREAIVGGYRYGIEGLTRGDYSVSPQYGKSETGAGYGRVNEIWEFTDSTARRSLNACENQVVRFPQIGIQYAASGGRYSGIPIFTDFTRVRIAIGDTASFPITDKSTDLKILGAPNNAPPNGNIYKDSALKAASSDQVWAVYAAGLGLVRMTAYLFESQIDFRLEGYVRDGVTVGTVDSDAAFIGPAAVRSTSPENRESHNSLLFLRNRLFLIPENGAGMRDLIGRQAAMLPSRFP